VVIRLNGTPIESANDFRNRIATAPIGQKIQVNLLRKGETVTLEAMVATYKPTPQLAALELKNKLGIEVREISGMDARRPPPGFARGSDPDSGRPRRTCRTSGS